MTIRPGKRGGQYGDEGLTVASVRSRIMRGKIDPPWQLSTTVYSSTWAVFVEVTLENGVTGWGECLVRDAPGATKAIVDDVFAPMLVGQNARRVQALWDQMYRLFRTRGHSRGIVLEALSGVDIALWDAIGRSTHLSISQLLLMDARESIPCYASSIMVGDERTTATEAERLAADGYKAVKIKVGQDVGLDARRVHLTRQILGPDTELMVDINGNFGLADALAFIAEVEAANVSWIEEPVLPDDIQAYRKIAFSFPSVPLAAGEAEFSSAGFRPFCEERLLAVFQPDVARAGGITGILRIAHLAHAYNVPIAPHVGACSGICAAASIQVSAALPNFRIYEHMYLHHGLQDVFVDPPPAPANGLICVPAGAGLGLDVDFSKVESMTVR